MSIYHNYIVIVGRLNGDDEDQARDYSHKTIADARAAFIREVREDDRIPEADIAADHEYTHVYINLVLTSESPINIET